MNYYKNLDLKDLPGEQWVDAYGLDGLYVVSTLGRIKRLEHYTESRWGTPKFQKEMIISQYMTKSYTGADSNLIVNIKKKTRVASRFIYQSFFPDQIFSKNDCVMHMNKIISDNSIINLKFTVRKNSKRVDMEKSYLTKKSVKENLVKLMEMRQEINKAHQNRTYDTCSICGKVDLKENFPKNKSQCKPCLNKAARDRRNKKKNELHTH